MVVLRENEKQMNFVSLAGLYTGLRTWLPVRCCPCMGRLRLTPLGKGGELNARRAETTSMARH